MENDQDKAFRSLLADLALSGLVKVTGSYADGTQTADSDIDFQIKPDHPDWKMLGRTRSIDRIYDILCKHEVYCESTRTGYLFTHSRRNWQIPIPIEFYDGFTPRPNRLKEVEIYGIKFKTH